MIPVTNRVGLEVGGPSQMFMSNGTIPLYKDATDLDCVCFDKETVWNNADSKFTPEGKVLGIFIEAEATDLPLHPEVYDYILSSHQLEHCANPIKALFEFYRVLKDKGDFLLILPEKKYTFDHQRPDTTFAHLKTDYLSQTTERDLTHFGEIMHLHDIFRDPEAPQTIEGFAIRSLNNYKNRCLHHHVFNRNVVFEMLNFVGFKSIVHEPQGLHLIFRATK